MELQDLTGKHMLDAADMSNEQVKNWGDQFEACEVLRFRLDGVVYIATEDPSDGYRSSMRELVTGDWPMSNTFQPIEVVGIHRTGSMCGAVDDVLELIDTATGKTVIEVGTHNTDDYYPSFVAIFNPAAMVLNATTGAD